jgi:hypothetical protein
VGNNRKCPSSVYFLFYLIFQFQNDFTHPCRFQIQLNRFIVLYLYYNRQTETFTFLQISVSNDL